MTDNYKIGDELYSVCSNTYFWQLILFEFIPYLAYLGVSVKLASQICHEKINTPLDYTYLADFGIDISTYHTFYSFYFNEKTDSDIEVRFN